MDYIYKEKKNGNRIISIRDKWENALIEFEEKGILIKFAISLLFALGSSGKREINYLFFA